MRLVFAGTPEFAATILGALISARHEIALVLTQPDRPAGRGLQQVSSAVKQLAMARALPVAQPARLEAETVDQVLASRPEAIVVAAYGLILPPRMLAAAPFGCLNVHASLLPRWRGAAPIQRALLAGDVRTGVTIMQMDTGLDTGPILLQCSLPIEADDTTGTLHDKLAVLGARLIVRALTDRLVPAEQPQEGVTYASRLRKAEAAIDWRRDAADIERQVRAFEPSPGAQTSLAGAILKIRQASVEPGIAAPPGLIHTVGPDFLIVGCGRDGLRITALQRAGGRRLPVKDYLAGNRLTAGAVLGPAHG